MEQPNLAMIPSAYNARVVYSILPNNSIGDFTFVRSGDATRINKDGLIETVDNHVPRLNYDLVNGVPSQCPSLLLEPQSTNLVTYSKSFDNSFWTKFNTTPTVNNLTSPDGGINAAKFASTGMYANINHTFTKSTSALTYTQSVFAKSDGYDLFKLTAYGASSSNRAEVTFSLSNGNINTAASVNGNFTNPSATITKYINDWYRLTLTYTSDTSAELKYYLQFPTATTNNNVWLWGAQLEQISHATSYIPSNSGSSTTRSAEACNSAGNASTFNSEEGILFAEFSYLQTGYVSINDGSNTNRIFLGFSGGQVYTQVRVNLSVKADMVYGSFSQNTIVKAAIKYKTDDFALWVNGVERVTDNSGSIFPINTINELSFDNGISNPFYGNTKDLRYYDTEGMTDTEITNLLTQLTQ